MTRPELFFGIINLAANQWLLPANSVAKIALPTVSSLQSSPAASEETVIIFLLDGDSSLKCCPPLLPPTQAHTPHSVFRLMIPSTASVCFCAHTAPGSSSVLGLNLNTLPSVQGNPDPLSSAFCPCAALVHVRWSLQ